MPESGELGKAPKRRNIGHISSFGNAAEAINKPTENLVLKVAEDGSVTINSVEVNPDELASRLKRMLNSRPDNVLYMDAANKTEFGQVLITMERCRVGGADPIVLMTREIK